MESIPGSSDRYGDGIGVDSFYMVNFEEKIKICFLGDGSHVNTQSWINYVSDILGHEVHLITFGNDANISVNIKKYYIGPNYKNFARYILCVPRVKKLINVIKPDILIAYRITSYGFMAACTGFHPLVLAAQGQNITYNNSRIKALFCKYAISKADMIHSWGDNMTQRLRELGASSDKIFTLPRGINTNLFSMPSEKIAPQTAYRLISTRGLNPDYNFIQILKAISDLQLTFRNFKYSIVGDGPYKVNLQQMAKKLGVENFVEFTGKIAHDKLPSLLRESDVYIATVATDGVSTSLLEAMASGVFPIVTNNASNRLWIKNGVNGYLVDYGDYQGLAQRIKNALENVELRKHAAEINRQIVDKKASIDVNMKRFENEWKLLI